LERNTTVLPSADGHTLGKRHLVTGERGSFDVEDLRHQRFRSNPQQPAGSSGRHLATIS